MNTYIGIDWSEQKHDVTFLNEAGVIISQFTLPHTGDGLLKLEEHRQQLDQSRQECLVALGTAHHLVLIFSGAGVINTSMSFPPVWRPENFGGKRSTLR